MVSKNPSSPHDFPVFLNVFLYYLALNNSLVCNLSTLDRNISSFWNTSLLLRNLFNSFLWFKNLLKPHDHPSLKKIVPFSLFLSHLLSMYQIQTAVLSILLLVSFSWVAYNQFFFASFIFNISILFHKLLEQNFCIFDFIQSSVWCCGAFQVFVSQWISVCFSLNVSMFLYADVFLQKLKQSYYFDQNVNKSDIFVC